MGTAAVRIEGGFIGIDARELVHAWIVCQKGKPGIGGFRAWLVAREMMARRQGSGGGRSPAFGVAELAGLLDVTERTAAASLRRLVSAGLIAWSDSAIVFPEHAIEARGDDALADTIGRGNGPVKIPRRLLRWLAKGARPALIATALGALLRCVSHRRSGFGERGRFKASWVAKLFGIDKRHVKSARTEFVASGWLEPEPGDQWAWNKWGRAFHVRLDWSGPCAVRHPSPVDSGAQSSPPDLHPDPLREKSNLEPAGLGPTGASLQVSETDRSTKDPVPSPDQVTKSTPMTPVLHGGRAAAPAAMTPAVNPRPIVVARPIPRPDLRDVRLEDLADTDRILALHRQAVARGRITASEADRIRFVAAVEHARLVGKRNPPGLLVRIVNEGWWHLLNQEDEDRASRRLREHDHPSAGRLALSRACVAGAATASPATRPTPAPPSRRPSTPDGRSGGPSVLADLLARLVSGSKS